MKIVQVCPRFIPSYGGIETHVREISGHLLKLGLEIEVFTVDPTNRLPKEELIDGIRVSRFHSFTFDEVHFFAPKLYSKLARLDDADLIHVHDYQDLPDVALLLSMKSHIPYVLTPHFHPVGGSSWRTMAKRAYGLFFGKRFLEKAKMIITVSNHERKLLRKTFGLSYDKIKYIPNGIDVKKFRNISRKSVQAEKVILFVGRLEKYKGVHILLKAFSRIKKDVPRSRLVVVGTGPYKRNLLRLACQLKLSDSVEFIERVSDKELLRLYCSSSVFVMPSHYEAFCFALVEAMACGLPVIATSVGGMKEIVQSNVNGFLVNYPLDEVSLADLTAELLTNQELSRRLGDRGRDFVLSRFSWEDIVRELYRTYEEVLHKH
jgi:glycosyltransferase involved in cell wall biosynthesis